MKLEYIVLIIVVVFAVAYFASKNSGGDISTTTKCFTLPTTSDPTVFGPPTWKAFHSLAESIPCPHCRRYAEKFIIFFHDTVNLKTGKPLYDPSNFNKFTKLISDIKAGVPVWSDSYQAQLYS